MHFAGDAVAISFKIRGVTLEPLLQAKPLMKACPKILRGVEQTLVGHGGHFSSMALAPKATKKALRAALAQECGQGVGTEHAPCPALIYIDSC